MGHSASQTLVDQICQVGDCKTAVDKTAAACEKDGAENGQNIQMIAAVCDPCLSNIMRLPKVCGLEMDEPTSDEFCGAECTALVTSMKNDKCEEKDWSAFMGGRRLSSIDRDLDSLKKMLRRLEEPAENDEDKKPAEVLKEMYAKFDQGCTDCAKAASAVVNHKCMNDDDEPDLSKEGCQAHVCKIVSDCPAEPTSSPIPGVELAKYNDVRAKLLPPCEAAEVLSGATRTIGAIGVFGIFVAFFGA